MPYITNDDKKLWQPGLDTLHQTISEYGVASGDLNYIISMLCNSYIERNGQCYTHLNEVIGVLECAKQEYYRRVIAPYEDIKIIDNGDIYDTNDNEIPECATDSDNG